MDAVCRQRANPRALLPDVLRMQRGKCPKGIPVADELRILAYNDFAGDFNRARENFWDLPREIRNINCSECASCAVECQNGCQCAATAYPRPGVAGISQNYSISTHTQGIGIGRCRILTQTSESKLSQDKE